MENSLVTYGFNKDREGIQHVGKNNMKFDSQEFFERKIASNSKYVVCFKKYFAGKGGFYEFIIFCNMRA